MQLKQLVIIVILLSCLPGLVSSQSIMTTELENILTELQTGLNEVSAGLNEAKSNLQKSEQNRKELQQIIERQKESIQKQESLTTKLAGGLNEVRTELKLSRQELTDYKTLSINREKMKNLVITIEAVIIASLVIKEIFCR